MSCLISVVSVAGMSGLFFIGGDRADPMPSKNERQGWSANIFFHEDSLQGHSRPRLIIQCAAPLHRCQVQIRTGEGANGGFNATEDTRDERTRFKLCIDNYLYSL
jgi:hypothetical protein